MAKKYLALLAVRLILPAGLLLSIALRPFGISVIYLLLYLISPLVSVPDNIRKYKGCGGRFLLIALIVSVTLLVSHGIWHSALSARSPYGSLLNSSVVFRDVFFNLGYVPYTSIDPVTAIQYVLPEIVTSVTSLLTFVTVKSVVGAIPMSHGSSKDSNYQQYPLCTSAGKYLALFLIMFSGIMRPSITSGIYFLVFLVLATTWSLGRSIEKLLAVVGRCLMPLMAAQTFILLVYQWTMISNDLYPPSMNFARYFGLTKMVTMEPPYQFFRYQVFEDNKWGSLAAPLVILVTYYLLAIESKELLKPKVRIQRISMFRRHRANSAESLLGTLSKSRKFAKQRKKPLSESYRQDSSGSVFIKNDDASSVSYKPKILDEVISLVVDLFQVIVRSSYIATTITMMAWSIMYHSWLTFVLLMWANLVWLRSDQRSFMLKTSPILVVYAIFLLILQYLYGMDLLDSELPSKIANQNLTQIGLGRTKAEPCVPLLVKSLFTCMFWVTLRQRMQDLRKERQASIVADLAAPFHLTASTAGSGVEGHSEAGRSRLLQGLGEWLRGVCAMYWIYVVVIMLVVIGITGERMTIFRIIYMFLFVAFILMFQISWHWWRRLMYVFWITVIIYSMINLIAIYIYQFDNSSKIIEKYLYINQRLQHDLGLSTYIPADLFVKLLTPTCFLIITIMQVHYFHKDFMAMSFTQTIVPKAGSSRPSQTVATLNQEIPPLPIDGRSTSEGDDHSGTDVDHSLEQDSGKEDRAETSLKSSLRRRKQYTRSAPHTATDSDRTFEEWARRWCGTLRVFIKNFNDHLCVYLEIHLFKIVYVALMLLCVMNVCALHVPIMLIIVPALHLVSPSKQRVCVLIISILLSTYLMAIMVYQIEYIQHSYFDVNCTHKFFNGSAVTKEYNNAEWVGFIKSSKTRPLTKVLKGYIGMIALFTFKSMVEYRQHNLRKLGLLPSIKDNLVFPEVKRQEADIDIPHCLKYLVNFGFYKFGVEITLICLMGVIGSRMDAIAVIYAIWLLVLVSVNRTKLSRVWPYFLFCITVLIPVQYLLAVGFIPQLCVWYPWSGDEEQIRHLRSWLFLPHPDSPPHASKLIFDFFLLLFAVCQRAIFRIEQKTGEEYAGGSNSEDIGHDWETENFVNPVPDFLGYIGSWLDVVKRTIFLGMLWVTLAIMFLTGTNRVNLFSMGYLIGSFIFLWQGTDFYLRPKNAILNWWSWLLRYNVGVVVTKTLLQIPGCMFSSLMQQHACWLVQLLGIGCVDKFAGGNLARFIKMAEVTKSDTCSVPQEDIGLAWDGVCFAFLILQRRFFHSYYFYRVIDESKATTVLASRGAELIEELRLKQMSTQEQEEMQILIKIKVKMEKIKANQKKIQGMTKEPRHHDADEEDTRTEPSRRAELVRGESCESRTFHTPVSSAPPSPGPPSPVTSALVTVSLSAYLDGTPCDISSPSSTSRSPSPSSSYPVFSPPPIRRRHTLAASPAPRRHSSSPRPSVVSITERHSHHTYETDDGVRRAYPKRLKGSRPRFKPKSHVQAVRSGDYYMFDEFDEADLKTKEESSSDEEAPSKELGIGKLVSSVLRTGDVKRAVSLRRASAPAVRTPRSQRSPRSLRASRTSRKDSFNSELPSHDSVPRTRDTGRDGSEPPDDQRMTEIDLIAPEPEQETWFNKLIRYRDTAWAFISSLLVSITRHLMRYSRDYRYVSRTLSMEKKVLKETKGFGIGIREGSQMIWEPRPETIQQRRKLSEISVPEIRILAPSMERGLDVRSPSPVRPEPGPVPVEPQPVPEPVVTQSLLDDDDDVTHQESMFSLQTNGSKDVSALDEYEDSMFRQDKSPFVHLAFAFWFAILAHTDIVCYIMVFINQVQSATILSIPLPLMVFLWGTLTIPRPTKTFWVTLIAYTEVIVLVKSMFQFEILPWNQKMIPSNMPFSSPRIIGIERQSGYALYDLLLLLIIFLHRFMLKSLGLWKESSSELEVHEDAEFEASHEDLHMIAEGHSEEVGKKYIQLHTQGPNKGSQTDVNEKKRVILDVPGTSKTSQPQLDDDHFRVSDDKEPIITVNTTVEHTMDFFPGVIIMSVKRYMQPMAHFFNRVLTPGARVTADVYAYMFLCDFFNFLVVIFGFAAFGTHQGDGGVQAYLEENKVPIAFLVMLILQFALIIIDRALYLRKYILGKLLFHYALIIGVHIWMFFVLPYITERRFNALIPPPMWYMVKCIYLLLSAYQIRCGYPRRIIGNFLCKSYRFINMVLFRSFMAVPFVFELRTLMDWIWTDTSMTLMDWLKMEDVFANVYLLKCSRYMEDEFPQERGSKKSPMVKYLLGGGVLVFIIAIIWFPLVFFAFGNTVGESNPPTDVTVKIRIGPFLPIFQMSAQSHNIDVYTAQDYTKMGNIYARDRSAQTFLSNYMFNDVAAVTINPNSTLKWEISPPELERLEKEAVSNATLMVKFTYIITHLTNSAQNPPTIEGVREVELPAYNVNGTQNRNRETLLQLLNGTASTDTWLNIPQLFPKFVKVFNKGTAKPTHQLLPLDQNGDATLYRDVKMRLENEKGSMYWRVHEACEHQEELLTIPLNSCEKLVMFTFNDKLFPETLNFISGSGIIGLYTTFVFLASRVLRGFFSGIYTKIMFDDLPNVDRVLQLCLDIYLVREALELTLEEDLFAKLVFLYRSPETMIKWSRPKEETDDQRALPPPPPPSP